jgi:hypothetical protein
LGIFDTVPIVLLPLCPDTKTGVPEVSGGVEGDPVLEGLLLVMGLLDRVPLVLFPFGADVKTGVLEGSEVIDGDLVCEGALLVMGPLLSITILGTSVTVMLTEGAGDFDGVTEPVAFVDPVIPVTGPEKFGEVAEGATVGTVVGDIVGNNIVGSPPGEAVLPTFVFGAVPVTGPEKGLSVLSAILSVGA